MARDSSGAYTLPSTVNPVVTLTQITSNWANTTLTDIGAELTNSLDRGGRGAMTAGLKLFDGSSALPGLTWGTETNSGLYRVSNQVHRYAVGGADVFEFSAGQAKVADSASGSLFRLGFRELPQVSQSAAYQLVVSDAGKHIFHPSADVTARIWTIPANGTVAFPVGTAVTFINQNGAGAITIAITTDTMRLAGAGSTGSRTLAANGVATAVKVTATEWIISGTGLT